MSRDEKDDEIVYWPKMAPNSPKLKVTFNDVPSMLSSDKLAHETDDDDIDVGKRYAIEEN